jgi:hypothetical protein
LCVVYVGDLRREMCAVSMVQGKGMCRLCMKSLERLHGSARVGGLLPSAIASELARYNLKRWDVTRRIQRMNKRLMEEIGQKVAEKRGHQWAPTSFILETGLKTA